MTRMLVALAALLLPLGAVAAPRPKDAPDEGLCFPVAVGTRWLYESDTGEYEEAIAESKGEGKATVITVVRTRGGTEEWRTTYQVSRAGLDMLASGGVSYERALPMLRAGATAGDEWEYTYTRDRTAFRSRLRCGGPDRVEVAAGKFNAVRLDGEETNSPVGAAAQNGKPIQGTYWYAPGVGMVRQVWQGQETTLKKFTPGK